MQTKTALNINDHLRRGDATLADLLTSAAVAVHPFVIGELACGS
jgi:hypothetical protein